MIEATKKKASFLAEAAAELTLSHVHIEPIRAEEAGRSPLRESFDVVVARAVATMDLLAEWLVPLAKIGGVVLAMKGAKAAEELAAAQRAIRLVGGGPAQVFSVDLPGQQHHVVVQIRKIASSAPQYPRLPTAAKGRRL